MAKTPNLKQIKDYFDKRIQEHGASPRGSDWNGEESQNIRFDQLLKIVADSAKFSILDYGCGYGALADYLGTKKFNFEYVGFDILESAIDAAQKAHTGQHFSFTSNKDTLTVCDYTVASGIFNFRGSQSMQEWTDFVVSTLAEMNSLSRFGFSSNFLTKYSDAERMRDDLYYADPLYLFDYCKRNFSRNVALLHDYQLYDFTIIVRKDRS